MCTRRYSDEPIFKVRKDIVWDESLEEKRSSEPKTSSELKEIEVKRFYQFV